jgi:hypothetical protein
LFCRSDREHWHQAARPVTEKKSRKNIVALSKSTKTDDVSRFFRDCPLSPPVPGVLHGTAIKPVRLRRRKQMSQEAKKAKNGPTHVLYVVERQGRKNFYHRVAPVWRYEDGNEVIALPPGVSVSGTLRIFPITKEEPAAEAPADAAAAE